ncbi:MAG: helix-turn-helix domain-containing protein [Phycisphaerales bacterium]|nr:helix-turn-helix domain-containing protein [Phycisphaerales bacterium]
MLYVDEGNVLTSAGSAAGLDLGLHLIRRDCGASIANAVARRPVIPPHRDGGQQQFIDVPIDAAPDDAKLNALLNDVRRDLTRRHTVESLARRMHMSSRTFARRFKAVTGTTPHRWLTHERVRHAQMILESGSTDIDTVARSSGFADAQLLRLHFKRMVGTSPTAYGKSCRGDHA